MLINDINITNGALQWEMFVYTFVAHTFPPPVQYSSHLKEDSLCIKIGAFWSAILKSSCRLRNYPSILSAFA